MLKEKKKVKSGEANTKRFSDICGVNHKPLNFRADFNILTIEFQSDWSQTAAGFLASYSFFQLDGDSEHDQMLENSPQETNTLIDFEPIIQCGCSSDHGFPIHGSYQNIPSEFPWLTTIKVLL